MRPRIQATVSQFSFDLLLEVQDESKGLQFSRIVDRIIIEWEGYQKKEKGHVKENERLREKIEGLEGKVQLLTKRLDELTLLDTEYSSGEKVRAEALLEKDGRR